MKNCDRCGEYRVTTKIDMYYHTEEWCTDCQEESADREPDYDAVTADETHAKAWQEHLEAHS
jgi:hypothetical protein